ncbi:MAG: DegT/DnrJ/EryC1/StrS aminotransferase family protein [Candidatus Sumerlaeaceae bacterium]|nr:DegT/DnrJ/EryC1/StrS aminotransferase family protein [Candidatus Sumerlaeaceae bacterium]
MNRIPFGDLARQHASIREELEEATLRVLRRGWYVLGSEVSAFEQEFAAYVGAAECVACASGTEAITLALLAHGLGPGQRVVTVANTCVPTVSGIRAAGAEVVLCDADPHTALMDPVALETELRRASVSAVVAVHLYGQPADLDAISSVTARHGAVLIEDAAQAHGAEFRGRRIGSHGNTVCWSFYPSKNLGAAGDGGAITTDSPALAARLRMLRNYGQERRYYHSVEGINSRLDEVQAALLRVKLTRLEQWNGRRRDIAARYRREIAHPHVTHLSRRDNAVSCEHLFPVFVPHRERFMKHLDAAGVDCLIHYPLPIHLQAAYRFLGCGRGRFPAAERLCDTEVSLPIFPELTDEEVGRIIAAVNSAPPPDSEV